jgi:hypothetical protein
VAYRFNPPPGWDVPAGFTPPSDWTPEPSWPAAPVGWQFWLPEAPAPPPPPSASGSGAAGSPAGATSAATAKIGGLFASLKTKAADEDWVGKAKTAASQATVAAQQAAGQATAMGKQQDESALAKAGPMPDGAVWRGVSHEAGRNSVVTLYPDRIERTKPTSKLSLTGMLTGGAEDVEVIPTRSITSVQVRRGAWYHDVTIYASGNTIVLSVDAAEAEKLRGLVMDQVLHGSSGGSSAAPAAPAPPAASAGDDVIEQIKKLGELRDAGLLTPEEFEAKKADLLSRL